MKKACLVVSNYLTGNKIFDTNRHRDNCVDRFVKLKKAMRQEGYDLSTHDINSIEQSQIVIYASNMPETLPKEEDIEKSYLILSESEFIRPDNYDVKKHAFFNKIFTWADDLVDNNKYIKLNYAHAFPTHINKDLSTKKKLCVLISGNKKPIPTLNKKLLALDLYGERVKAIRWFEANQPNDFDLYGVGWDRYRFSGPKIIRALNRIPRLAQFTLKLTGSAYSSYKGTIKHKKPIMQQYKFSISYENARDIPGYITEKIFDSFFAGCVPIYWGANNISNHIPTNTFIDKRNFESYEELHRYIKSITDSDYLRILENIEDYLYSDLAYPYKSEGFAQTIIRTILNNYGRNKR
ncbi:glycosyltransferase family 10 [Pelagicoccus sp. SDUM812003]|uniref:glycosyltransferase family 10 domain-containing protein n=1 Tax=Pelagicoccus sp. SDUM812003 TaxID=3041267 RepID=UPI0028104315|nr:glycosyltransferase family 10 [Pelagicoccus sp. SDUM812003]MDQ8205629.1 glycosyltransferase family 10 [Pelagicoccus sp. SDUM812003]